MVSMTVTYEDVSPQMAALFDREAELASWLEVEGALARAQAALGIIPQEAAERIADAARLDRVDLQRFEQVFATTVHPVVSLVRLLADACDERAGEYVHWGITTQDVVDTGLVLRLVRAHAQLREATAEVRDVLVSLARTHRDTVMVGRTNGQHATPITFGYKLAVHVDELDRHLRRLDALRDELSTGQLGGATGTLAALGPRGLEVRRQVMAELGLREAPITWHVARDRQAEFAFVGAMIAATVHGLAREVVHLQRTEIGELEEPFPAGKVGSSTMPHKRNPAIAQMMCTIGELVRADSGAVLAFMSPLHEREKGHYQLETTVLASICSRTHRMLQLGRYLFEGLTVDVARMRRNLQMTGGLVHSEALMMRLAAVLGRQSAHERLNGLAMASVESGSGFRELLLADEVVAGALTPEELDHVLAGGDAVSGAGQMVDRVCGES